MDIFPPAVDDAYEYGQIAAANSLSDVWAMGGEARLCMNILMFPEHLPFETVQAILRGGYDKVAEAEAIVVGGHTIKDDIPKYGLCVSGVVHPDRILRNNSIQKGDVLILTKALGTGILTTAWKGSLLTVPQQRELLSSMEMLNRYAAQTMEHFSDIHACTDVTGFGLLGHAYEMAAGSNLSIAIDSMALPALDGAVDAAAMGLVPAGAYKNREYLDKLVNIGPSVPDSLSDLMFDPQTSGGLLISVPEKTGIELVKRLNEKCPAARIIGQVETLDKYPLTVL